MTNRGPYDKAPRQLCYVDGCLRPAKKGKKFCEPHLVNHREKDGSPPMNRMMGTK